jgi:DNA-binding LacI/PurR family transcriptional regulator
MASLRDVAKDTGFSTSTVSRVINNREGVDPETKKKIVAAIDRLAYKPNLVAQGLRVRRGNLIGLVVPQSTVHVFSLIIRHALEAAWLRGYDIVVVNSNEDPNQEEERINDLLRRNINGIIFSRVSDESRILPKIMGNIPTVIVDRAFEHEKVASVVLDNRRAGYLAGQHLVALGHEHIACVTGPLKIALCRERLEGFREALGDAGLVLPEDAIFEGDFKFAPGEWLSERLVEPRSRFSALWAMNDLMAFRALRALINAGRSVPGEVSLAGMDDTEYCEMVSPTLTSIHYPFQQLAERAVEILLMQIDTNHIGNETIVLQPGLTVRESTGRVAQCMPVNLEGV